MKTLTQIAKENGFKMTKVTAEELEDGIGVIVGENWIKDQVWYTTKEMVENLGLVSQAQSGLFDASIKQVEALTMEYLRDEKATWYHIEDMRQLRNDKTKCAFIYG